jgi:hypothetical protein
MEQILKGAALLFVSLLLVHALPGAQAYRGFIRADGTKFVDASCREFNFVGVNV